MATRGHKDVEDDERRRTGIKLRGNNEPRESYYQRCLPYRPLPRLLPTPIPTANMEGGLSAITDTTALEDQKSFSQPE